VSTVVVLWSPGFQIVWGRDFTSVRSSAEIPRSKNSYHNFLYFSQVSKLNL